MSNHDFATDFVVAGSMGLMTSYRWQHDPKTVLFVLARYKFVAKMLDGYDRVLEVGCGDAFGSRLVAQTVGHLKCIDIDKQMIDSASEFDNIEYECTDNITEADAIYALDVIEHIPHVQSREWLEELSINTPIVIIGTPSLESQPYASKFSKENHINTMTEKQLRELMKRYFEHVFLFGMNDETLTTSFGPMCHYRFAIGTTPKK